MYRIFNAAKVLKIIKNHRSIFNKFNAEKLLKIVESHRSIFNKLHETYDTLMFAIETCKFLNVETKQEEGFDICCNAWSVTKNLYQRYEKFFSKNKFFPEYPKIQISESNYNNTIHSLEFSTKLLEIQKLSEDFEERSTNCAKLSDYDISHAILPMYGLENI